MVSSSISVSVRTPLLLLLPATENDDGTVRGGELLPQLRDEEGVVGQSLLHRQQAHLGDVEGRVSKRQRLAVVPLDERQQLEEVRKSWSSPPACLKQKKKDEKLPLMEV